MSVLKVFKWMGVNLLPTVAKAAVPILTGGTSSIVAIGTKVAADLIQGAVTKAQAESPEAGTGETRAEIAMREVTPALKVGILAAQHATGQDVDEDALIDAVSRLIRAYADILKILGLRKRP